MQCLNLNNKEVKAAVDEVAKVLGSEDAAYYIISENNSYAIDQGPDGSQSELFSDLLKRFDGDRDQAIRQIAKTFISAQERPSDFFSSIGSVTGTWSDGSPHMSTISGQIVERLKQYIPKDSIAYQILDLFSDTDVYIGITEERDQLANGDYMWYSSNTHTIWISKEIFEETDMEYNAKSIVHEMVHAFTSRSFENVKNGEGTDLEIKVYNKVKDLLEFNRKLYQEIHAEKGKWTGALYGLKDEHEFIAEFLTNEEFVNNIIDDARQKGLFEEVISKIREVWSAIIDLLTGKQHVKIQKVLEIY